MGKDGKQGIPDKGGGESGILSRESTRLGAQEQGFQLGKGGGVGELPGGEAVAEEGIGDKVAGGVFAEAGNGLFQVARVGTEQDEGGSDGEQEVRREPAVVAALDGRFQQRRKQGGAEEALASPEGISGSEGCEGVGEVILAHPQQRFLVGGAGVVFLAAGFGLFENADMLTVVVGEMAVFLHGMAVIVAGFAAATGNGTDDFNIPSGDGDLEITATGERVVPVPERLTLDDETAAEQLCGQRDGRTGLRTGSQLHAEDGHPVEVFLVPGREHPGFVPYEERHRVVFHRCAVVVLTEAVAFHQPFLAQLPHQRIDGQRELQRHPVKTQHSLRQLQLYGSGFLLVRKQVFRIITQQVLPPGRRIEAGTGKFLKRGDKAVRILLFPHRLLIVIIETDCILSAGRNRKRTFQPGSLGRTAGVHDLP